MPAVGDMENINDVAAEIVPENPYGMQEVVKVAGRGRDADVDNRFYDKTFEETACVDFDVDSNAEYEPKETDVTEANGVIGEPKIESNERRKLIMQSEQQEYWMPIDKESYLSMSIEEKALCYPLESKDFSAVYKLVESYFKSVGMDTSFTDVYDEAKMLTDYYEKKQSDRFVEQRAQLAEDKFKQMALDANKLVSYPIDMLANVFGVTDVEYGVGIKIFARVLQRIGAKIGWMEQYELFDKVYSEGMREKNQENRRLIR